jgi:5S rRNA maturation endonuclease (ribonuclease M5)/archaellum biogenesis ATPase FlaH
MTAAEYVALRESRGATARKLHDGWMVSCAAHEDRTPSLHVSEGNDGRLLLHCQTGNCTIEEVLAADGLTTADLFEANGHREIVETYTYIDEHGAPLFEVVRFDPKDFRQRRPDGSWGVKGVRRVLYRLPKVLEAVKAGQRVWIVEGERDVHAMEKAGQVATCNPGGAGKWRDEYSELLAGAHVVIVADDDGPGEKHALAVKASIEQHARKVTVVKAAKGKDARDHLAAGLELRDFVPWTSTPATETKRYAGRVLDVREMLAQPDEPIPWRCDDLVADGYLTVLAGSGGEGKSWLALALACGVARGARAAGISCTRGRALVFDAENGAKLTIRRFRAAGITGDVDVQPVDAGGLRVTTDLPWFRKVIEDQRANLVVFDSLRVLSSGSKESDGDEMEPIITALKELARETGAAVLLIHHRGKNEASEYRGSSVIRDQTDLLFTLGRVAGDPERRRRRRITTIKCRIEEEPEPRWVAIEADRDRGLVYVNEAEPFEEEDAPRPRDAKRDDVLSALADGPLSEVAVVKRTGIPRSTVKRILRDLDGDDLAKRTDAGWGVHLSTPLGNGHVDTPLMNGSNGNGWHPHAPDEDAPEWWPS